ncbi:MAG: pectin acetylesterase-family hydrolase [Candidatus Limnocylindrales bacterium]
MVFALLLGLAVPAGAVAQWAPFETGPDTVCADGSRPTFSERVADPERVVMYFEGGGACWSEETCDFDDPDAPYRSASDFTAESLGERGGVFDFSNPENPLAEHSWVYVPYCTGDLHLGDTTSAYGDLIVEHRGAVNAGAALDHLVSRFPDARELVVTGISAGSVPTPLYAGLLADRFPEARIVTLGDGSGSYPDDPVINAFLGTRWGVMEAVPDWPGSAGLSVRDWSVPGLYVQAGQHAPEVTFARFDFAYDDAQAFYGELVGVAAADLVSLMDRVEADIEAQGVPVASYTAPGNEHTLLWRDLLYEVEVDGVRLVDWITRLVEGETPDDVRCTDCR